MQQSKHTGMSSLPPESVLLVAPKQARYENAQATAASIAAGLQAAGLQVDMVDCGRAYDLALAIGGDGTMMQTVTALVQRTIPTLGVNAGDVGFLTSAEADDWQDVVSRVVAGQYAREDRLGLQAQMGTQTIGPIANEVVVRHQSSVVTLQVEIAGQVFYHQLQGDGVLVATATGSTGYNTSANGPILLPGSGDVVLTALNPMSLSTRPIVSHDLAAGRDITITVLASKRDEPAMVIADGVMQRQPLAVGESITVQRYPLPLQFATFGLGQYARALREKKGFAR